MNSGAPGTLAVGRVKFYGRHRGEVRPCRALLRTLLLGFVSRMVSCSLQWDFECSLGSSCRMGARILSSGSREGSNSWRIPAFFGLWLRGDSGLRADFELVLQL